MESERFIDGMRYDMERLNTDTVRVSTVKCRKCDNPIDWNPDKEPPYVKLASGGGWLITCKLCNHQARYTHREIEITWIKGES